MGIEKILVPLAVFGALSSNEIMNIEWKTINYGEQFLTIKNYTLFFNGIENESLKFEIKEITGKNNKRKSEFKYRFSFPSYIKKIFIGDSFFEIDSYHNSKDSLGDYISIRK